LELADGQMTKMKIFKIQDGGRPPDYNSTTVQCAIAKHKILSRSFVNRRWCWWCI